MKSKERRPRPHRLADRLLEYYCKNELLDSIQGDLHEQFLLDIKKYSLTRSHIRYWGNVFAFINRFTLKRKNRSSQNNTGAMIKNYLLITLRNLKRRPVFSFINLFGLAIGLATCMLIFFYIRHETSFDQFHENSEKMYRVANVYERSSGANFWVRTPPVLASAIRDNFPGVSKVSRSKHADNYMLEVDNNSFEVEFGLFADSLFLNMFDYELLMGDKQTALDEPNTIVLGKDLAVRFFGDDNPMGKTVRFANDVDLKVTGVLDKIPSNSHLKFDYIVSFSAFIIPDTFLADLNSWGWCGFYTYMELEESVDLANLKTGIDSLLARNYDVNDIRAYSILQPLEDIYLDSGGFTNHGSTIKIGSRSNIYALSAIAVLVLIVASFNFMNLSTAMSLNRGKEIGVRKVMGAVKGKIRSQFLAESVLLCLFSMVLAIGIALMAGPLFLGQLGIELNFSLADNLEVIPLFMSFSVLIGLLSGIYPSFVLSAFNPILAMKGRLKSSQKGAFMRKGLTLFQFIISLCLIAISLLVVKQVDYMRSRSLGFDKENVLVMEVFTENIESQYGALKNQLAQNPYVVNTSRSSHVFAGSPGSSPIRLVGAGNNDALQLSYYQTGYDFLQLTGIELLEGRFFSKEFPNDLDAGIVLNETAVKELGLTSLIGQRVTYTNQERVVIGVVKDFHFESMHTSISPMGLIMPFTRLNRILIKVNSDDYATVLSSLERDLKAIIPESPLLIRFMDEGIQRMYEREENLSKLVSFFSIIAVLLACLGLYGLVNFSVQARLKEVGIRKILGASLQSMFLLLSKQFLWLIAIASLVAWPLTYFVGNSWLESFSYRLAIGVDLFVLPTLLLLLLALLTLSHQIIKAALSNPVKVLRSE